MAVYIQNIDVLKAVANIGVNSALIHSMGEVGLSFKVGAGKLIIVNSLGMPAGTMKIALTALQLAEKDKLQSASKEHLKGTIEKCIQDAIVAGSDFWYGLTFKSCTEICKGVVF
jgi:hypothetical protein